MYIIHFGGGNTTELAPDHPAPFIISQNLLENHVTPYIHAHSIAYMTSINSTIDAYLSFFEHFFDSASQVTPSPLFK